MLGKTSALTHAGKAVGSSNPALATVAALFLSVIAPILITFGTPYDSSDGRYVGPLLVTIFSACAYSVVLASRARQLFSMTFWLFVYVFLGVAPMIQLRLGQDTNTAVNINHDLDWQTTAVVLVGCLAFLTAWLFRGKPEDMALKLRELNSRKVNVLTLAVILIFAYYASKLGVANLFVSRLQLDFIRGVAWPDRSTATLVSGAAQMGLLVAVVAQIHVAKARKAAGERVAVLLPLVAGVCLLICVNPISSPRYVFGTVLLALLASMGAFSTLGRFRIGALAAIFGMVYLFPIMDMFRTSLTPNAKSQNPLEAMLSGDFDSWSQVTNSIEYVDSYGHTWGSQMLGVLFFWLPRSVWPGKPVDTGSLLADFKLYDFRNLSAPLWGELLVNGGWVALLLGMVLVGVIVRRLDRTTELTLQTSSVPGVLGSILPFYMLILLRGSLLQSMAYLSVILLAYLFVKEGAASKSPRWPAFVRSFGRPAGIGVERENAAAVTQEV
ncbi:hypothetical protein [Arthrobacter sp. SLBN-112]|uniref:hypothetical protein n=1 Tax=Arthrobacter sp. SLBN-112 TaxID=2768452 RepID=UPI0027B73C84|nr:hypothetical protein [Arthrobacter sp. SLBN-112]MDQ0800085.1 hypothetical protein [Arthrobacter sp. SLBN-112]